MREGFLEEVAVCFSVLAAAWHRRLWPRELPNDTVLTGRGSSPDKLLGPARVQCSQGFLCCSPGLGTPRPGLLSLSFTFSSPAVKMPSPRTVTSGPELHSPKEPTEPKTPVAGRAGSAHAPGTQHGDARLGLATLRRAFARASLRASGPGSEEDPGLLRRSSRFLLRSLRRRALDDSPAADQCQATAVPGVTDGVSRQLSTGAGPEEPETEAGESFTDDPGPGGHRGRGWRGEPAPPDSSARQRPQAPPTPQLHCEFSRHLSQGGPHRAGGESEAQRG